jgi:hypothetical protein
MANEESHFINECLTNLLTNQDDFLWINFMKPCGYNFMYPFQRSDTVQALYRHLDNLWAGNQIMVWFQPRNDAHVIILNRSEHSSIRDFLYRHHILRSNELSYNVFFETTPYHNPLLPPPPVINNINNNINNVPWALREMQLPRVCACHPPATF